jgi:hypothetical protein
MLRDRRVRIAGDRTDGAGTQTGRPEGRPVLSETLGASGVLAHAEHYFACLQATFDSAVATEPSRNLNVPLKT